jgi:hypothetical protein
MLSTRFIGIGFVPFILALAASGQTVPKWHTRDVTRLTQVQISDYLKRKDVIFVAVGATEAQGRNPSDREYIAPLGSAAQMAEEGDAVYLPNVSFMYPGSTITSAATVYLSIPDSFNYLKAIAHSLYRQGFHTQIWVWHGHGPSPLYVGAMARDFFEEVHVPILALDASVAERNFKGEKDKIEYGKYALVGHIEDMPLASDMPAGTQQATPAVANAGRGGRGGRGGAGGGGAAADDPGLATLNRMGYGGSLGMGYWWSDPEGHGGGGRGGSLPMTAEDRAQWGKVGMAQLAAVVKSMDLPTVISALQAHAKFTHDSVVSKYGSMLPGGEFK